MTDLQRLQGGGHHNVVRLDGCIFIGVYPLHSAKATHKEDVQNAVHAEEQQVGRDPSLLLLCCMLLKEDLHMHGGVAQSRALQEEQQPC